MISDRELINQIRQLREIKPDSNWSVSVRAQIVGHDGVGQKQSILSIFGDLFCQYRIAVASLMVLFMMGGTAAVAQNALPGDPLYGLKRATEKGMALVAGKDKVATANLELAAKRLEEINLVSQKKLVQNLPAAVEEYKNAKAEAKNNVAAAIQKDPENAGQIVKDAVVAMKGIADKEREVYGVLGLEQNASTSDSGAEAATDQAIVGSLIEYFQNNEGLSENQQEDLEQVRALYDAANYGQSLDKYLNSSLNK